ncbi:MAG: ABC transporter permease [Anaerolineae bacterium]|nr:ABC transporter permease [Anaerolineae bacterium]
MSAILFAMLRMTAPLILAATGGLLSQQAGMINVALEGLMLVGAFAGVLIAYYVQSAWIGALAAIVAGALFAGLMAVVVLKLRANLIVVGLALNLLALGLTRYLLQILFATRGAFAPERLPGLGTVEIPALQGVPILGDVLLGHSPLVYLSWVLAILSALFLNHVPEGLRLRAVGENPEAARSLGIPVDRVRALALIASGCLAGLAGVQLSLGNLQLFFENMTNGRGFIALAAIYFGQARPGPTLLACLLFGLFEAIQIRLQTRLGIPPQWPQMLPFILVIVVLAGISFYRRIRRTSI